MGESTGIAWAEGTVNFWIGCTPVGPGCEFCYAEAWALRNFGIEFGVGKPRRRTAESTWNNPVRWNREWHEWLEYQLTPQPGGPRFKNGKPVPRWIFTNSLADFFDNEIDPQWRKDAWAVIKACKFLRWQIVTKRVGNVVKMLPEDWGDGSAYDHVGILATVTDQNEWDRDVPKLIRLKDYHGVKWIGLSVEPMLGPIYSFDDIASLDWVICGGESKQGADHEPRFFRLRFAQDLRDACVSNRVPYFHKQMGGRPIAADRALDERGAPSIEIELKFKDRAGADPAEWPEEFRIQQMPRIYDEELAI